MSIVSIRDHIREKGIIPKKVKTALTIATKIYDKVPRKGDHPIHIVLKLMSIADSIESSLQTKKTEISAIVERLGLATTTNTVFASMFFGTKLQEQFELKRYILDGNPVIEAINPEFGRLLFIERWEKQYSPTFYHTKGFNFEKILKWTWELYDGRLQFEINWSKSTYTTFSRIANPLYGKDAERMDKVVERHMRYLKAGKPRAYMFYGAPGTGKTSFALAFAQRIGDRILRIDARSFSMISVAEIIFIIDALQPDFIMVDDVDKADVNHSLPTILNIIQELKTHNSKTSLMLTANNVGHFDHGLLRPGRIDSWLVFNPPDADERNHIIRGYLAEAEVELDNRTIEEFVKLTDGLTQDYLREVAQRLKYESVEEVITLITSMRKLLGKPDVKPEEKAPEKHLNGKAATL
jgi:predicted AAA+ superfamily ATPase